MRVKEGESEGESEHESEVELADGRLELVSGHRRSGVTDINVNENAN